MRSDNDDDDNNNADADVDAADAAAMADRIEARLAEYGDPRRAANEGRYLKNAVGHLGVRVPDVRRTANAVRRERPDLSRDDLFALTDALWRAPVHERRLAVVELLRAYRRLLEPADLAYVEELLRDCHTWALLDPLAVQVVGRLVARRPDAHDALDRWAADTDFWLRRAALLALLPGIREAVPDLHRFERYADAMLAEREFFVRKAIGWVLREIAGDRPGYVRDWVAGRTHRISGVTIREAVRHLPAEEAQRLLTAYRRKVPAGG